MTPKLLQENETWETLPETFKAVLTGRRLVCVAEDIATRCILGMRMAPTATADLARQTLRMVTCDKTRFAEAAGALTPWDMRTTPDLVVTDGGPAFISDEFAAAVADIGSNRTVAKAKEPHLRGGIERFFRTVDLNLLCRCTGRSFAGIDDKGDHAAEAHASLTEDDFAWILIRWLVDKYHNTKHDGLGGETPRNAWLCLARLVGLVPPPDREKARTALGVGLVRSLAR